MAIIKRPTRIGVYEDAEKLEPSYLPGRHMKRCHCFGKQPDNSQKTKQKLPYDLAIPFLGIYSRELKTYVHIKICTQILIAVLFIIVKNEKQSKCPRMDK